MFFYFVNNLNRKLSATFDISNLCEEFMREFEILWVDFNECKINQTEIMKKLKIDYSKISSKNDKADLKLLTPQTIKIKKTEVNKESNENFSKALFNFNPDQHSKRISIEKKLVKGIIFNKKFMVI